jgi:hypothetical protein
MQKVQVQTVEVDMLTSNLQQPALHRSPSRRYKSMSQQPPDLTRAANASRLHFLGDVRLNDGRPFQLLRVVKSRHATIQAMDLTSMLHLSIQLHGQLT